MAENRGAVRNGPQLTWTNVISTLGFGTVLLSGIYIITQQQISAIDAKYRESQETVRRDLSERRVLLDVRINTIEKDIQQIVAAPSS